MCRKAKVKRSATVSAPAPPCCPTCGQAMPVRTTERVTPMSNPELADWIIRAALDAGPQPATVLYQRAERWHVPLVTLKRIAAKLQVQKVRKGFGAGGSWWWSLP